MMKIRGYIKELERAYRVLGPDKGEMQNHSDIKSWEKCGYVTGEEAEELHFLNFKMSIKFRTAENEPTKREGRGEAR